MLRKLNFSIFIILLVVFLGACSNDDTSSTDSDVEDQESTEADSQEQETEKSSDEVITLRLAENQPDNNPVTIAMYKFSDLVEEKSNGEINIEVYANAQLGEETANIDQVQAGSLDMARVNSVPVAEIIEELGVFTLPFIFEDQDHKYKVLDGEIGEEITEKFAEHDLKSFGYLESGTRNFYTTNKPIQSV